MPQGFGFKFAKSSDDSGSEQNARPIYHEHRKAGSDNDAMVEVFNALPVAWEPNFNL